MLKIKRVYTQLDSADGYRILVDRLWPRGLSQAKAQVDNWFKTIAPSSELRHDFHHDPALFPAFKAEYLAELHQNEQGPAFIQLVKDLLELGNVTLLYGAKDEQNNQAVVLKQWLETKLALK